MTTAEGDIDTLEGRMTTAEGDIGVLEETLNAEIGKCVVWIGDSYTQANSLGSDQNKRFSTIVSNRLNMSEFNYAVGGCGFLYSDEHQDKFATQIENAINAMTNSEKNTTKYVFVCGGRNDPYNVPNYTLSQLNTEVNNCANLVANNFPNATLIFIPMLWDSIYMSNTYQLYMQRLINCCLNTVTNKKVVVIQNAYQWLLGKYAEILTDGVHPNVGGHLIIANYIVSSIFGGSSSAFPQIFTLPCNYGDCTLRLKDGVLYLTMHISNPSGITFGTQIVQEQTYSEDIGLIMRESMPITLNNRTGEVALAQLVISHSNQQMKIKIESLSDSGTWVSGNTYHGIGVALNGLN